MTKSKLPEGSLSKRRRLAEALRTFSAEVVACDAPDEAFLEAAEAVEGFVSDLAREPRRERVVAATLKDEIRMDGKRYNYGDLIDFSPVSGVSNPIAPPVMTVKEDEATISGTVNFSAAYEGGPGLVHGGYVAAAFDEVLGLAQSLTGKAGMTGTLKVRYRNPCPLHQELRMEARVHSIKGRKIIARGTMHNGEQLIADGEATFIIFDSERFRRKLPEESR